MNLHSTLLELVPVHAWKTTCTIYTHRTTFKCHFYYTIKKGLVPLLAFNGGPRLLLRSELRSSLANSTRTLPSAKTSWTASSPVFPPNTSLPRTVSIHWQACASSSALYFALVSLFFSTDALKFLYHLGPRPWIIQTRKEKCKTHKHEDLWNR